MKNYTWTAYYTDGTTEYFYCKKSEILDYMSVRNFVKLDRVEVMNSADDKVNHRPVNKAELAKGL